MGIDDIMLSNDVVLQTLMNELGTFKKQYVEEKHVNQDGTPRAIKLRNLGKGPVYVTNVDGNKRISAKSKKDLIQKLYIYYSNGTDLEELKKTTSGYTVNDVFEMALLFVNSAFCE